MKKNVGFPQDGRAAHWDFPQALPLGNPSEQPCQPLENPVRPFSFTRIKPMKSVEKKQGRYNLCNALNPQCFGLGS